MDDQQTAPLPGASPAPSPSTTPVFVPNVITVAEGETITFHLVNTSTTEHKFKVGPELDVFVDDSALEVDSIGPGLTANLTYTFKGAGPFAFASHEDNQFEDGMLGYVVVVGPDVPKVGTPKTPRLVPIAMTDVPSFVPASLQVAPGETITFLASNVGVNPHEFQVGPAALVAANKVDQVYDDSTGTISAGRVFTLTYTFPKSGAFAFASHLDGQYEAGMRGVITIR
jgi:uncharacterized cupredoxin-like copper-binding protein